MKLEIAEIADCEVGEVVKAARGDYGGASVWALVSEATEQDKKYRGLLWLEASDRLGPAVHINYSAPLLRTHAKAQIETTLEAISIVRSFPDTQEPAWPHLMAVGNLFGFFCREMNVTADIPTYDNVLVTLDGEVKTFSDFPHDRRILGLVNGWKFTLADASGMAIANDAAK